jgi:hypothetical protein
VEQRKNTCWLQDGRGASVLAFMPAPTVAICAF